MFEEDDEETGVNNATASDPTEDQDSEAIAKPVEEPEKVYVPQGPVNVRLALTRKDDALPPGITNIGPVSMEIPELEVQMGGFNVSDPSVLVSQFPQYKYAKEKGDKNVPMI